MIFMTTHDPNDTQQGRGADKGNMPVPFRHLLP